MEQTRSRRCAYAQMPAALVHVCRILPPVPALFHLEAFSPHVGQLGRASWLTASRVTSAHDRGEQGGNTLAFWTLGGRNGPLRVLERPELGPPLPIETCAASSVPLSCPRTALKSVSMSVSGGTQHSMLRYSIFG